MLKAILLPVIFLSITIPAFTQNILPAETVSSKSLTKSFVCEEMIYPEEEMKKGVEGTVTLKFVVMNDGSIDRLQIQNSVSDALDKEAIRVFRMIEWKPATRFGTPVNSEASFSIPYNIKKYKKKCKQRGYESMSYPFEPVDNSYTIYTPAATDKPPRPKFEEERMYFAKFVHQNLEYPESAYKQDLTGTVTLEFIVETHGRVSNITIKNSVGGGCNEEAIRLLKLIRWMPGIKNNMAVRTKMAIDISFELSTDSQHRMYDYNTGSSI
jgi:protein TonB